MSVPELDKFRQRYPQYGDLDDATLATKLAAKYPAYADLPGKVQSGNAPAQRSSTVPYGVFGPLRPQFGEVPAIAAHGLNAASAGLLRPAYEAVSGQAFPQATSGQGMMAQGAADIAGFSLGAPGKIMGLAGNALTRQLPGLAGNWAGRIGLGSMTGAVGGAVSDLSQPGQIPVRAVAGGVLGAGAGAVGEAYGATAKALKKPVRTGLANSDEVVQRMSPEHRDRYFEIQRERVQRLGNKQQLKLKAQSYQEATRLGKEKAVLEQSLRQTGHEGVLKVRQRFGRVAREQSQQYRDYIDAAKAGADQITITRKEMLDHLSRKLPHSPDEVQTILQQVFPENTEAVVGPAAFQNIDRLSGQISKTAKQGGQYTFHDKVADDARDSLIELLEGKGVTGFDLARAHWKKWAPTRNKALRDFKPYLSEPIETQQGTNRLIQVAKRKDVGNANYVRELENLLGENLTGDVVQVVQRLDANQKAKVALQARESFLRDAMKARQMNKVSGLRKARFDAEEAALRRSRIAQIIRGVANLAGLRSPSGLIRIR